MDAFAATVGSGGTFSGTARELKRLLPDVRCMAVEPAQSPLLSGGKPGPHKIQGIGAGFVPANYDPSVADGVLCADSDESIDNMRLLARKYGLSVGISSGAAFAAAIRLADSMPKGSRIAAIFPDDGNRYLSV